jgi:hypothetical protein
MSENAFGRNIACNLSANGLHPRQPETRGEGIPQLVAIERAIQRTALKQIFKFPNTAPGHFGVNQRRDLQFRD